MRGGQHGTGPPGRQGHPRGTEGLGTVLAGGIPSCFKTSSAVMPRKSAAGREKQRTPETCKIGPGPAKPLSGEQTRRESVAGDLRSQKLQVLQARNEGGGHETPRAEKPPRPPGLFPNRASVTRGRCGGSRRARDCRPHHPETRTGTSRSGQCGGTLPCQRGAREKEGKSEHYRSQQTARGQIPGPRLARSGGHSSASRVVSSVGTWRT